MNKKNIILYLFIFLVFLPINSYAEIICLRMSSTADGRHEYFCELLKTALVNDGHDVYIKKIPGLPLLRKLNMLKSGGISIARLFRTPERDKDYIPIPVNLTNGLIGKRVLLIPAEDLHIYEKVKTLDEFRNINKVAAFGKKWFDVGIWKENDLPYKEVVNVNNIYKMVATKSRGLDYFTRGFNEVLQSVNKYDALVIEPHLLLEYNHDFIFYLSPQEARLKPVIGKALLHAKSSGLIDKLIHKYWSVNFEVLKPENRTVIKLKSLTY
ncbi:hypothetical protein [Desulfovibrio sp. UCD-KL4C]|uniref:hypothetical protein n=1 Tax=Desulfovibrio sp. UCD-KL4C TaxID=2578120 RepID=UPI0025BCFD05|nr:hypothetical protein [Desulfovibrio sp. UCD-KL4C]